MNKKTITTLFLLASTLELYAQRDRPSRGRTSSRTGSSSSSSGSSSSTVGSGSWSSSGSSSSSSSSSSSGSYSGGGYSSGGSSSYTPTYGVEYINRARKRMRGKNTAPIITHRLKNGWSKPINSGNVTAIQNYHSGRYRVRRHVSFLDVSCHGHYYNNPNSYYHGVDSGYVYQDWLFEPAPFHYSYGYNCIGGYPYYVHNGYKHRYSSVDMCNYELLDLEATNPVKTFYNIACNIAFDQCAAKRDQLNDKEDMQKYVCVEKVGSDYANKENKDRIPSMINKLDKTAVQKIEAFLNEHTPQALFKKGLKGIEKCKIIKSNRSKNKQSCNFYVEVNGNTYPLTNKSVCSNAKKTPLKYYGCQSSSQKKNAACLLSIAVAEGYCN